MDKPRILVVDDDELVLRSTLRVLRREFDCVGTLRPAEALEHLRQETFAAVVSDVSMPIMTGRDLLEAVCKEVPAMSNKFVFLTGGSDNAKVQAWLETVEHLTKPCKIPDLIAAVRKITG